MRRFAMCVGEHGDVWESLWVPGWVAGPAFGRFCGWLCLCAFCLMQRLMTCMHVATHVGDLSKLVYACDDKCVL